LCVLFCLRCALQAVVIACLSKSLMNYTWVYIFFPWKIASKYMWCVFKFYYCLFSHLCFSFWDTIKKLAEVVACFPKYDCCMFILYIFNVLILKISCFRCPVNALVPACLLLSRFWIYRVTFDIDKFPEEENRCNCSQTICTEVEKTEWTLP
jgi:hypothetical protein